MTHCKLIGGWGRPNLFVGVACHGVCFFLGFFLRKLEPMTYVCVCLCMCIRMCVYVRMYTDTYSALIHVRIV